MSRLFDDACIRMLLAKQARLRVGEPASVVDRWFMLEMACLDEPMLVPDATEIMLSGEVGTIDTVEKLGGTPDWPVIWILGDDAAMNLPRWIRYDKLKTIMSILVVSRTGGSITQLEGDFEQIANPLGLAASAGRMFVYERPVIDISASAIRCSLNRGESLKKSLHSRVLAYIIDRQLYQNEVIFEKRK